MRGVGPIEMEVIDLTLIDMPANPVPNGAVLERVVCDDSVGLRVARWAATAVPIRGVICLLQGRAEFIEKYFETIDDLRGRGFHVATLDWRGQGGSDRAIDHPRKGHVDDFSLYQRDVTAFFNHVAAIWPGPRFALAHSMGACILFQALRERPDLVLRHVALAPMVRLSPAIAPRFAHAAAAALDALGFGGGFIPGGGATSISTKPFANNRLTSDAVRYARNAAVAAAAPHLAVGDPTIAWLHAAFRAMVQLQSPAFVRAIRTPSLVLAAGADPIVDPDAVARLGAFLKAGRSIAIPGARHELLMERDAIRDQVLAAFDAFVPGSGTAGWIADPDQPPASSAIA